jgi:hypothetical protein
LKKLVGFNFLFIMSVMEKIKEARWLARIFSGLRRKGPSAPCCIAGSILGAMVIGFLRWLWRQKNKEGGRTVQRFGCGPRGGPSVLYQDSGKSSIISIFYAY